MDKYPFVKCFYPQQIINPYTKEVMLVGCGKCAACQMQKSSIRTLKCKLESMSHKYTYFVTLTYTNEFVPRMLPLKVESNDLVQKHYFYFYDSTPRLKSEGEILYEGYLSLEELDRLRTKTNLGDHLPYLSKRDAQLFIKRLRKNISKYSHEKIRYYLVGEYGPVHFRPHYHLELWFSDDKIAENLQEDILKSWSFGRVDVQKSVGKSSSYVAGYLNSFSYLPSIYSKGKTKPFACHSFFLGEAILQSSKEEVYKLSAEQFVSRSFVINGVDTKFSLWRSFKTTYYPRCPRFATLNTVERYQSYTTYEAASELFGKITPFQLSKNIVDSIFTCDIRYCNFPIIDYFKNLYNIHPFIGRTTYEKILRQVYYELRISKLFIDFVCDGFPSLAGVKLIEKFYSDCDMLGLSSQLSDIDDFLKSDGLNTDDIVLFYHNTPFDVERLQNNLLYRHFYEHQYNKARDSVKHKYLNDKNLIFCEF